jgi:hypothetical protein
MKQSIPYIILATVIGASVLAVLAQNLLSTSPQPTPNAVPVSMTVPTAKNIPTAAEAVGQCGYMWATHNADELGAMIDEEIRAIDPAASGNASYYGEDCVYADEHSTFSAMETDFYVRIPVDDLTNEEALGNWISQIMKIVITFPLEQIQGNYGFVEFWFEKSEGEQVIVRVPIQEFMDGTHGITGAALFRMFYVEP